MIEKKGYLTALTNLSRCLAVLWRSHKVFQILVGMAVVSSVAAGTFVTLKEVEKRRTKVFAATSATQVELPKGIKKEDVQNLNEEQKEKLDRQIASALKTKFEKERPPEEGRQVVVVVLTQNGQPILPDLEREGPPSPAGRSEPTPTLTPSPTPVPLPPCTDSDGGKDYFTKGTVTTSYGDKKIDFCSDPNIVGEYSCVPGAIFAFDGFICPGSCSDGACLRVTPTPTPSPFVSPPRVLTPTITPTPTNVPCTDSDGGKDIYTKGTVNTWGKSYTDVCFSLQSGEKTECSDYFCRLLEYSCQPQGYYGEGFTCQYGCKNGACLRTPPTSTPTATPQPKSTSTPTSTPIPTLTAPPKNELTFVYEGGVEQSYKNITGNELKDTIDKIYQSMKKILGPPFRNNTVRVKLGQNNNYYNVSTNELLLKEQQFHDTLVIIGQVFYAFYDDLFYYLPDNWGYGFFNIIRPEVQIDVFTPEKKSEMRPFNDPLYELTTSSPAWASKDGKISGTFGKVYYYKLLAMTFYKLYLEDNQFFVKFNKELYRQTLDNTLQDKLSSLAAGVKPTAEGVPFNDWYDNHYLLRVKPIPGKYLIPYLEISGPEVSIIVKAVEVLSDGTKKEPSSRHSYVQIFDSNNNSRHDYSVIHYDSGGMNIGKMPTYETTPNISSDFKGALRFDIDMTNFAQISFYYPYENGRPIIPGGSPLPGVFGTINRSEGYVRFKGSGLAISSIILEGMFQSKETFFDTRGPVELSFYPSGQNLPPGQSGSSPKMIAKDFGDYYTTIRMVGAASSSRGVPISPGTNCTDGWQDYEDEDFKLKFKIPPGWTDNSIDEHQSETFSYRHLISTDTPEQQLDPKYKVSYFDILASTSDLKDSDYGTWLENNTGNQQKSQIDFKGISVEKYVDDTKMPCASQTEEGAACNHHSEIYYFEKDDIYYLLSLGIYTSVDVKEQNEANLKCFLENFALSGQEEAVAGMKLFTSQRLQFKIRYPAELFVHEWQSSYKPNFNSEKPDSDRNVVQFFKNKDLRGEKITIRRDTNSQRKTARDFAKAYWSASEENLKHWKPGNIDFVIYSVKVQGSSEEEKTYLTPLGDWMYIFDASDASLQPSLEKMLPTLEFLGSGEGFSEDLIPCPDDLYSTAEQLKEQQEDWWTKPDPCDSRPEKKVCGYIRSIYDNGVIQVGSQEYRNAYCYCSFFEKNGSRTYRGTQMFALGYKEGACK